MKIYTNWEVYIPFETEKNSKQLAAGGLFLRDDKGTDWYDLVEELSLLSGKYFVLVNPFDNMVLCYGTEPWMFAPAHMTFCVFDSVPDDFSENFEHYRLDGKKLVADNSKKVAFLKEYVDEEIAWASSQIGALEDIQHFGKPTQAEEERLLELRKYRFTITRLNTSKTQDIQLPDRP